MNITRKTLSLSLAALLLGGLGGCAPKATIPPTQIAPPPPETAAKSVEGTADVSKAWPGDTFKVCADPNNPPFSDKAGLGFENKIAELLANSLGKTLDYYWFPQRMGFIRNTLKAQLADTGEYRCDVIMGYPTGAEMAATTKPYYRSTYALVLVKGRGFDDIKSPEDLLNLPEARKRKLKLGVFDGSPGATWLLRHGLMGYAKPYQSMGGDAAINTAEKLEQDMKTGKLDMTIVWGPIAGWLQYHHKLGGVAVIPMHTEKLAETGQTDKEGRFEYPISMAVRIPDKARKAVLNELIDSKAGEIRKLLETYQVPLLDDTAR